MHMTSRLTRVAAAAVTLFVATGAFAEGRFTPELGWGRLSGGHIYHVDDERREAPSFDAAFGYRWDNGLGVRALYIGAFDIAKVFFVDDTPPSFNDFYGVQATGAHALGTKVNLTGGLGLGRTSLNRGQPGDHVESTEGIVSAGLQYQPFTHFALELHADWLTRTHERNLTLMAQVPF
jgi:hypothetical protein